VTVDREWNKDAIKSAVLGHPDKLLAEGVASLLVKANYRVSGVSQTEAGLRELALKYKPDSIIFEPAICAHCPDLISILRREIPEAVIVLVTKRGTFAAISQAIKAGASGCVSVDLSPEEFARSLESLLAGDVLVSKDMTNDVRRHLIDGHESKQTETLTRREVEVLRLVGAGSSNREIGQELFISEHTVKAHLRTILAKLDLRNRQQVAAWAVKNGVVSADPQS
jgi:DNA-binding NarL/FixJ family response regulator